MAKLKEVLFEAAENTELNEFVAEFKDLFGNDEQAAANFWRSVNIGEDYEY